MNFSPRLLALSLLLLGLSLPSVSAQETTPPPAPTEPVPASAATEGKALVDRIKAKLQAGENTEAALAAEIAEFDTLLAKYAAEKTDDVAQLALMKAMLYVQVFENTEKGLPMLKQIKTDFPETKMAKGVDRMIQSIEARAKAAQVQAGLVGQPAPELHFTWSTQENLKSLADLKGKVVVLDFWATWCGPCIASFPHVAEVVAHYKDCDVAVVGVTSIQGRVMNLESAPIDCQGDSAKEIGLMPAFIAKHAMTWPVAISSEPVFNPAYGIQGIPSMVIIAPDGTVRQSGLHPMELKTEKIDELLKEFNLKLPTKA